MGDPLKWPRIYEYNNQPGTIQVTGSKIVDPDLIIVGQSILMPSNNPPTAQPVPVKEPETSSGWDKILAVGLVVVATVVVVGTIVEDVFTAGAGTADDPASSAAAETMMYKAQRLWSKLPARNAIKMDAHGLKNVAPAF